MSRWLLQFTVRDDEVKQNRRLPEIAFFDTDGNPISLSSGGAIQTWAPTTDYTLGQVVIHSGSLYQAVDDHTSGATFAGDSAHWTALDAETDALALAQLATHAGLTTTAHGGIVASSDSRLTNARTPTAHKSTHATGGSDVLSPADIGAVATTDPRLTDSRPPNSHKTTHGSGGSDPLSPADIGAATAAALTTHAGLTTTAHGGIVSNADSRLFDSRTPIAHKATHAAGSGDALSPADIGAIAASLVDAKGDLLIGTADNTPARKAVGSNGKFLSAQSGQSDGLLWDDPVTARTTVQWTTASLANNASENDDQAVFKASQCYSITTDRAARVRAYSTSAHRTADAARAAGTDPTGNHGCLMDVVTVAGTLTLDLSPVIDLVNLDGTPATTIYFAVTNTSGSTSTVQVTLTVRKSE